MTASTRQGRLLRLCQKELKETLRDRRTIITLVLMPLLVYPLLSMALNRFLLSSGIDGTGITYLVALGTNEECNSLQSWLSDPRSEPPDEITRSRNGELATFRLINTNDLPRDQRMKPVDALMENKVDVVAQIASGQPPIVRFTSFRDDRASESARSVLIERLQWLRMRSAEQVASDMGGVFVPPTEIHLEELGESRETPLLATIVPLILVLMTITGAVYPAIDLTAGERERGTMESLMASPVPRFYVLLAKYVAVVIVALLTAIANLLAMFTTLWAARLLPLLNDGDDAFPWLSILQILGLLILFSGFFSALLLALTSFAKSFKEAQAYLIPVMLLSLAPAMLSLMPGVRLTGPIAVAPLINIVLLARDLLSNSVEPVAAVAAVASTFAYAAAAIGIAASLFGSDAVTRTSEQSIGTLLRRPSKGTDVPTVATAALMLALLVPIYFVVSNLLIRVLENSQDSLSISSRLILNAVALVATFGLIPLVAALAARCRLATTYRLRKTSLLSLLGAALIGLGAWTLAHESFILAEALGVGGLDEQRIEQALKTLDAFKQAPPWLLVTTLALVPAVIEELCFRGFLFSSLSKITSPARVIVITALLFGLFHVLTGNALLIERFVPTTLLGLVLGWIAYRTRSVFPGMLMHFIHNALLELVAHYHDYFEFLGSDVENQTHLPPSWLFVASLIALSGVLLITLSNRKPASSPVQDLPQAS